MTPAARAQAAIDVLDRILAGDPAEKALSNWARSSRFAGSSDRAAVRDHVFQALRCRKSYAHLGRAETGRGLMVGHAHAAGLDITALFDGSRHGPGVPDAGELVAPDLASASPADQLDCPAWAWPLLSYLGEEKRARTLAHLQNRAEVFLRVNLIKSDVNSAIASLAKEDIVARPHDLAQTALVVVKNARRIKNSQAYRAGLVELQDAASQALVEHLAVSTGARVLDYCAGGGGKSLAIAALCRDVVYAHDANPLRMKELPERAKRAGVTIMNWDPSHQNVQFDLVLCDAPCSGSGAWARVPDGKWRTSVQDVVKIREIQATILKDASQLVSPNGRLAYATCSLFPTENRDQIDDFIKLNPDWHLQIDHQWLPEDGGDGFYLAVLTRAAHP